MEENNTQKFNYEAAMKELEGLVQRMESGEMSLDNVTKDLSRAKELIKKCKDKLETLNIPQ